MSKSKLCSICHTKERGTLGKRSARCNDCYKEQAKKLRQSNPEYTRQANLWYKYGVSIQDYNRMFESQGGCCAICGTHQQDLKRKLFVDHNHSTGKVRSLLCPACNFSLGHYEKSKDLFEEYLNKYDVVAIHKEETK